MVPIDLITKDYCDEPSFEWLFLPRTEPLKEETVLFFDRILGREERKLPAEKILETIDLSLAVTSFAEIFILMTGFDNMLTESYSYNCFLLMSNNHKLTWVKVRWFGDDCGWRIWTQNAKHSWDWSMSSFRFYHH